MAAWTKLIKGSCVERCSEVAGCYEQVLGMVLPCVRMRTPVLRRQHKAAGTKFSYFMNGRKIQLPLGEATFRVALGAAEHCLCERAVLMKILTFGIQPQSSPQCTTLPGLSGPPSSGLFFYLPLACSFSTSSHGFPLRLITAPSVSSPYAGS